LLIFFLELEKARAASGGNTETISLTAYALARSGRSDEARKTVDELQNEADQGYVPSYNIALAYNGLGESGQAFHWLYDAVERHDVRLTMLMVDHKWDNLRSDPRFLSIIKRIGLE
jgi:adenylate cyclase